MELRPPAQLFDLQHMGEIYDRSHGKADEPHRHDYYTVLLTEETEGIHHLDYQPYPFDSHQVHFVGPGQIHQVELGQRPEGLVITFSRDFLIANNIPESFITNLSLFRPFGDGSPLVVDEETFQQLKTFTQQMKACAPKQLRYGRQAQGALLQLFLIYCNHSQGVNPHQLDEENKTVCLLRDFKNLVDRRFHQWHKVLDYASEINISPKHLSHSVKSLTGKTAKEIIQDRLVLEAKRSLLHTRLSVKEVAYQLGFEEPLHFSSFFKHQVGISPSDFRQGV